VQIDVSRKERSMSEVNPGPEVEVSSDDRLWAALSWLPMSPLYPVVAIMMLLMEEKKNRPYIRHHAVLALATGAILIPVSILTLGLGALGYLVFFYWAYQAYQGQEVHVPAVSDWLASQE
jgi:uncharacterized membrane protein